MHSSIRLDTSKLEINTKKLIVFGASRKGIILSNILNVAYFVDDDTKKCGKVINGFDVKSPQELIEEDRSKIFILVASFYYKVISWRLEDMGFIHGQHFCEAAALFTHLLEKDTSGRKRNDLEYQRLWLRGNPSISESCTFGGHNTILDGTRLVDTHVGRYTCIGHRCSFTNISIGQFCSIGSEIIAGLEPHPIDGFISSYPGFYMEVPNGYPSFIHKQLFDDVRPVVIGNDVWIGSRAMILAGVTVGDGSVVGANAVVTKDIEPYSIVAGIPARLIRKRFSDNQIDQLLKFKWWDREIEWIKKNAFLFADVETFFKHMEDGSD
ncbi:MAG: CatB-related O-acetyltransferase [Syntrophobacteraceae bacterium]|jgi:acetyltransferase-like isoleucine patch superfamily enzyme